MRRAYELGRSDEAKANEARLEAYRGFVEWTRLEAPAAWGPDWRTCRVSARIKELESELAKGKP